MKKIAIFLTSELKTISGFGVLRRIQLKSGNFLVIVFKQCLEKVAFYS
jgi:hypothetical protein